MKALLVLTAILALSALTPSVAIAQHGMPGGTPMTFFVTSEPIGDGGNLGGLAGADAHCQKLASAVGAGNQDVACLPQYAGHDPVSRPSTHAIGSEEDPGTASRA